MKKKKEYDHSQNYINPSLSPQGDNSVTPKITREASYTILSEKLMTCLPKQNLSI